MIDLENIQECFSLELKLEVLLDKFLKVTDYDDTPDLTNVHPRDRTDLGLYFVSLEDSLFPKSVCAVNKNKKILDAVVLGLAPHSQMYTHIDQMELGPYSTVDWTSVVVSVIIPSSNSDELGLKIGDEIISINKTLAFDAQIPHSAWNNTDQWWIFVRLRVSKN